MTASVTVFLALSSPAMSLHCTGELWSMICKVGGDEGTQVCMSQGE